MTISFLHTKYYKYLLILKCTEWGKNANTLSNTKSNIPACYIMYIYKYKLHNILTNKNVYILAFLCHFPFCLQSDLRCVPYNEGWYIKKILHTWVSVCDNETHEQLNVWLQMLCYLGNFLLGFPLHKTLLILHVHLPCVCLIINFYLNPHQSHITMAFSYMFCWKPWNAHKFYD